MIGPLWIVASLIFMHMAYANDYFSGGMSLYLGIVQIIRLLRFVISYNEKFAVSTYKIVVFFCLI